MKSCFLLLCLQISFHLDIISLFYSVYKEQKTLTCFFGSFCLRLIFSSCLDYISVVFIVQSMDSCVSLRCIQGFIRSKLFSSQYWVVIAFFSLGVLMVEKELVSEGAWLETVLLNYGSRFIFYFHTLTWREKKQKNFYLGMSWWSS